MSTSLIILIPVILLGIVGMLCFVGCTLPVEGLPSTPFTEYSGKTVLLNPAVMAYWPLNDKLKDTDNPAPALERVSNIASSYVDMATAMPPEIYPWPLFNDLPNPPGLPVNSAAAPGNIDFNQPGLVKGDAVVPAIPSLIQPCVVVNGCYVEVPFVPKLLADTAFTIEAWVRVDWSANDPNNPDAWRFVVDARDFPGKGFALFAKTEDNQPGVYRWAGVAGNGGAGLAGFTVVTSTELTITLSSEGTPTDPVYLALTCDGKTLTLFVNGKQQGQMPSAYVANTVQPLWIGAGAPYVDRRPMQQAGMPGSPLFPFVGAIQDVAIYKTALMASEIDTHFRNGSGKE
jgi:hypothetical protein